VQPHCLSRPDGFVANDPTHCSAPLKEFPFSRSPNGCDT
jgi:hypothetical protein